MSRPKQLDEYLEKFKVDGVVKITDTETGEIEYSEMYDASELDLDEVLRLMGRQPQGIPQTGIGLSQLNPIHLYSYKVTYGYIGVLNQNCYWR